MQFDVYKQVTQPHFVADQNTGNIWINSYYFSIKTQIHLIKTQKRRFLKNARSKNSHPWLKLISPQEHSEAKCRCPEVFTNKVKKQKCLSLNCLVAYRKVKNTSPYCHFEQWCASIPTCFTDFTWTFPF